MCASIYTITYPPEPAGSTFDMDYFLNHHMPMVVDEWTPYGYQGYEILKAQPGDQPSQIVAIARWGPGNNATIAPRDKLLADIPNFTATTPLLMEGESIFVFEDYCG